MNSLKRRGTKLNSSVFYQRKNIDDEQFPFSANKENVLPLIKDGLMNFIEKGMLVFFC
jgi:hypothetical protein